MTHAAPSEYGTILIVRGFCSSDLKKSEHAIDTITPPLQSWESLSFERRYPVLELHPKEKNVPFPSRNIIRTGGDQLATQVKSALAEEVIKIDRFKRRVISIYSSAREERSVFW